MAPSLPDAYIPKPNLRLEFPLKPHCQWAQLELFISWWMGLNNPERRERECVDIVFRNPANAPISNPSFNSSLQLLSSELWRDSCPNPIHACHNKSKATAHWRESGGICICSRDVSRVSAKPQQCLYFPEPSGYDGRGDNLTF